MKNLNFLIEDKDFNELATLMTHHGERTHMMRILVKKLIKDLKEAKNVKSDTSNRKT